MFFRLNKLPALALLMALLCDHVQATPISQLFDKEELATPKADNISLYDQALLALDKKQLEQATALFRKAAEIAPSSPLPWIGLAEVARLNQQDAEVEQLILKAVAIAPKSGESQLALGRLLFAKRKFTEAESAFLKAAAAMPTSTAPVLALGELYANALRQPEKAVKPFQKAIELKPNHAGAHYGLGMAYLAQADTVNAGNHLKQATRLAPDNVLPLIGLSQAQATARQYKEALSSAEQTVKMQPNLVVAWINQAEIASAAGQAGLAENALTTAARLDRKSALIHLKLGMLYQQTRQWQKAYQAYETATSLDPNAALAFNNLAWVAAERKERLDEALSWAQKASTLAPQNLTFKDTLAWVKYARGDKAGAAEILSSLAKNPSADGEIHYHLAIVQAEQVHTAAAKAAFNKALQLSPNQAFAEDAKIRLKQLEKR